MSSTNTPPPCFTRGTSYYPNNIQTLRALPASNFKPEDECYICSTSLQQKPDYEDSAAKKSEDQDARDQLILQSGCCLKYTHKICLEKSSKASIEVEALPFPTFSCPTDRQRLDGRLFVNQTKVNEDGKETENKMHIPLRSLRVLTQIEKAIIENDSVALTSILESVQGLSKENSYQEHPHIVFGSLRLATWYGNQVALKILFDSGCSEVKKIKTNCGYPQPLTTIAVNAEQPEILDYLITKYKANPNGALSSRPLVAAAAKANLRAIRILSENKVTWGLTQENDKKKLDPLTAFMLGKERASIDQQAKYSDAEGEIVTSCLRSKTFAWNRCMHDPLGLPETITPAHLVAQMGSLESLKKVMNHLEKNKIKVERIKPPADSSSAAQETENPISSLLRGLGILQNHPPKMQTTPPLIFNAADASSQENFIYLLGQRPKGKTIARETGPDMKPKNLLSTLIIKNYVTELITAEDKAARQYDQKIDHLVRVHKHPCRTSSDEKQPDAADLAAQLLNTQTPNGLQTFATLVNATMEEVSKENSKAVSLNERHGILDKYLKNTSADKSTPEKIKPVMEIIFPKPYMLNYPCAMNNSLPLETALILASVKRESPVAMLKALVNAGANPDFANPFDGNVPREMSLRLFGRDLFTEELNLPPKSS